MKKFKGVKRHKPKKNNAKYMVWVLAGIMVLSTAGFLVGEQGGAGTNTVEYKDKRLELTNLGLHIEHDGKDIYFQSYPDVVEDMAPSKEITDYLKNARVVAITYDPNEEQAELFGGVQYQLEKDFVAEGKYVLRGLVDSEGYALPELTCLNSTPQAPVVLFRTGNNSGYYLEESCVVGEAFVAQELVGLKDALMYSYYGVFE